MTTATTTHPPVLLAALETVTGDAKHTFSALSTLDVLWVLYDRVLRVSPATIDEPDRDRFLLSKGHGPAAFYAVLAAKGFIPSQWLVDMGAWTSRLGYHPDRTLVPGAEISSGSLGHGLGLGVGTALGLRAQGYGKSRVVVLVGDAELDEGANHEAIAYAGARRSGLGGGVAGQLSTAGATGLDSLTAIVIDNQSTTHGWPGGIASRFTANGWAASTVDGRDQDAIEVALRDRPTGRPQVVVAVVEPKGL